jgi:hypothetical protein
MFLKRNGKCVFAFNTAYCITFVVSKSSHEWSIDHRVFLYSSRTKSSHEWSIDHRVFLYSSQFFLVSHDCRAATFGVDGGGMMMANSSVQPGRMAGGVSAVSGIPTAVGGMPCEHRIMLQIKDEIQRELMVMEQAIIAEYDKREREEKQATDATVEVSDFR